jgi:hypothetical protein
MSLSIREVLENAEYNEQNAVISMQKELVKSQRENYNIAKELGANDGDDWDEWSEKVTKYKNK